MRLPTNMSGPLQTTTFWRHEDRIIIVFIALFKRSRDWALEYTKGE
jgi:hypothetical protein